MNVFNINPRKGFRVLSKTQRSEAATMVIAPGDQEGGPGNKHHADQWLFVLTGTGEAIVSGDKIDLSENMLIEIEAEEEHEIRNTGDKPLRTLNFYAPPAF